MTSGQAVGMQPTYWYVDVAAVRIQTWLGRTARLRFRRGGSYRLAKATSQKEIHELIASAAASPANSGLPIGLEWNPEAGEISGVAPLRFPDDGSDDDVARERARTAALLVAEHIRSNLPACPLTATWGRGASYVEAYATDMEIRVRSGDILLDFAGDVDELVLARACQGCRQARVVWERLPIIETQEDPLSMDLCPDCASRFALAGRSKATVIGRLPASQRDLAQALNSLLIKDPLAKDQVDLFPSDFSELAARGDSREGDAATHLALIMADGNGIGALMKEWLTERRGAAKDDPSTLVPKNKVVSSLDWATKQAIVESTRTTFREWVERHRESGDANQDDPAPPVLVHLAGGDDLLLSVPAAHAWTFARHLAGSFERACTAHHAHVEDLKSAELERESTSVPGPVSNPLRLAFGADRPPTLSIGMVFHHSSHPFADVVEKAEAQLGHAKGSTDVVTDEATKASSSVTHENEGLSVSDATIAFHDLTADGERPPQREPSRVPVSGHIGLQRRPVTVKWLNSQGGALDALASTSRSHRSMLTGLLRECREGKEGAAETLGRRVADLEDPGIAKALMTAPASTSENLATEPELRNHLRLCLDIARWWPEPPKVVAP